MVVTYLELLTRWAHTVSEVNGYTVDLLIGGVVNGYGSLEFSGQVIISIH